MRGEWAPCGPRRGRAAVPQPPLPGPRCRYPPPPHRTHPSRRSSGGSAGENGEQGALKLGRPWGTAGGDSRGQGRRRGMGRAPRAARRPCPLPEPFRSVTWDPDPGERRVWWPEREASGKPAGEGNRPLVPTGCPWPLGPPRVGICGWRERPLKRVGAAEEGAGRRAVKGGGGRCHSPLFSLESGGGGGRPEKRLFVGPENSQGSARGPRD